jgi:hypothetical protein
MPSTSVALSDTDKPARALQIRGKLLHALNAMVWDGLEFADAARNFKMSAFAMRKALAKPHVQAYLRSERQVLRESLSPRNIHRLREIRDAADNMPAIQAIRTLEQMGDDQPGAASGASASPGITIRIINTQPSPPMIDVTPNDIADTMQTRDDR